MIVHCINNNTTTTTTNNDNENINNNLKNRNSSDTNVLMILIITNSNTSHTTLQTLQTLQELIASLIQEHMDGGVEEDPDGLDAEGVSPPSKVGPLRWSHNSTHFGVEKNP